MPLTKTAATLKVTTDVLFGFAPLTKQQLAQKERLMRNRSRTPVERCLSIINCKLLMGSYMTDCNHTFVDIGDFATEVVESALEILRTRGNWEARIASRTTAGGVRVELVGSLM